MVEKSEKEIGCWIHNLVGKKERAGKLNGKLYLEINSNKQENQLHIKYNITPAFLLLILSFINMETWRFALEELPS